MGDKLKIIKGNFEHLVLEGSSYEIGRLQGEIYKRNSKLPEKKDKFPKRSYFTSARYIKEKSGFRDFNEILEIHEEFCPGINDEIQGFADSLGVLPEKLAVYDFPYSTQNNCSQLVLLPSVTEDKHLYVVRSYDWKHDEEDNRLCTTRVKGKFSHVGFSTLLFGRMEGLNSRGLCASMTGGGAWSTPVKNKKAFDFWIAIRSILENCRTVNEAIDSLLEMPVKTSTNYAFADKSGRAALVEGNDSQYAVKEIDVGSSNQYLFSTNHYTMPEMKHYNKFNNPWLIKNSKTRYATIKTTLKEKVPRMTKEALKELLSKETPDGLCAHWQSDYFGTLWSEIFDVTNMEVDICFGTTSHNDWNTFTIEKPDKAEDYNVIFVDKPIQ
ncbi:MAG: C45 family autoproteolytic acyltransferase/hydrolase [Candidatus Hodarchaeales archaeon]|jgi:predicted choloylglycine hydrolase